MIFVIIILGVFLFDFAKLRQQNKKMIQQNDTMIHLLKELQQK